MSVTWASVRSCSAYEAHLGPLSGAVFCGLFFLGSECLQADALEQQCRLTPGFPLLLHNSLLNFTFLLSMGAVVCQGMSPALLCGWLGFLALSGAGQGLRYCPYLVVTWMRKVLFTPKDVLSTILVKTLETKRWFCLCAPGFFNSNIAKMTYCKWAKVICERLLLALTGTIFYPKKLISFFPFFQIDDVLKQISH